MHVRLKAKLAEVVNGLDLSHCAEGDVIQVNDRDGGMLLAERWAEQVTDAEPVSCTPKKAERAVAADNKYRGWRKASVKESSVEQRFYVLQPSSPEHER